MVSSRLALPIALLSHYISIGANHLLYTGWPHYTEHKISTAIITWNLYLEIYIDPITNPNPYATVLLLPNVYHNQYLKRSIVICTTFSDIFLHFPFPLNTHNIMVDFQ